MGDNYLEYVMHKKVRDKSTPKETLYLTRWYEYHANDDTYKPKSHILAYLITRF